LFLFTGVDAAVGAAKLITGGDVKDNSLTSADIKDGTLKSADVKDGTLKSADVKNGTLQSADVKDGTLQSADVKNGTLQSADVKDQSLTGTDVKNESLQSADIKNGTIGTGDLSAAARSELDKAWAGPNWSIVDRNVIGNGDAYLRAGPSNGPASRPKGFPPSGVGSLGLRTGSADDAAAFGNQVDFLGKPLASLTQIGYSVFTTQENRHRGHNMPAIAIEINPKLDAFPGDRFSTIVYEPANSPPLVWKAIDAVADAQPHWGITGLPGTTCDIDGGLCTFAQLRDFLNDGSPGATILTVQITKGRNLAFSGAVDDLQLNDTVYDFEPTGVYKTAAP